jgi:hypothetical protein
MAAELKTEDQQRKLDTTLNKTFLDLGVFSLIGLTIGMGASLFFRRGYAIRNFAAGFGGSYAIVQNQNSFTKLI